MSRGRAPGWSPAPTFTNQPHQPPPAKGVVMPHIQVTQGESPDALRILIDGEDWSDRIYRDGFGLVRVGEDDDFQVWGVSMVIAADSFDFDLPEGVILAEKESPCRKCAAERDGIARGGVV